MRYAIIIATLLMAGGAQAVTRIFYDNFESGNTNLWGQDASRNRCQVVPSAADGGPGPFAGSRMASCNWNGAVPSSDNAAMETLTLGTLSYSNELFFRVRVRVGSDLERTDGSPVKLLRIFNWTGNQSTYNDMFEDATSAAGLSNRGNDAGATLPTYWGGASGDNTNSSSAWHKVEYYFNAGNGTVKVWHDGILVRNDTGRNLNAAKWYPFFITSNWADAHDAVNHIYFDDMEIYSDATTGSASTGSLSDASVSASGSTPGVPSVSSVSGSLQHQGALTITGSGFGTKTQAAPLLWDDSSGTDLSTKWSEGLPNCAINSNYNVAYRTPIRGITPPHTRVGRYIAGAHGEESACSGYDVMVSKVLTDATRPVNVYVSWYQRSDDNWVFGLGSPADNNYKVSDWSNGTVPYSGDNSYVTYNPSPGSRTDSPSWAVSPGMGRASTAWGGNGTNPMNGMWTKVEEIWRFSAGSDGKIQIIDNGITQLDYTGITDTSPGTSRTLSVGGYSRGRHANNWRYFTDIYLDTSWARVILGNASTYAASTRREVQIPSAWSNTSISISANLGAISPSQTAYLYVIDASGNVNANGFPVTLGGTPTSACDLNNDGPANVSDVQLCINQAIGVAACLPAGQPGSGNIDGANGCNVIDVQRVVNAALGGSCVSP